MPSSGPNALVVITTPVEIDVDLVAEVVERKFQQRPGDGDAGIIDQAEEVSAGKRVTDARRGRPHRILVGHVENKRHERRAEFADKSLGVGLLAHAAEHAETTRDQDLGGTPADPRGCSGDNDTTHARLLGWPGLIELARGRSTRRRIGNETSLGLLRAGKD